MRSEPKIAFTDPRLVIEAISLSSCTAFSEKLAKLEVIERGSNRASDSFAVLPRPTVKTDTFSFKTIGFRPYLPIPPQSCCL
jgi:hypothetical protein